MSPQFIPESNPAQMADAIAEESASQFSKYVEKLKGLEEKYPKAFQRNGDVVVLNNYRKGHPVLFDGIESENDLKLCVFTNSGIYVLKYTDMSYDWVTSMQKCGKFVDISEGLKQEIGITNGSIYDVSEIDDVISSYGGEEYLRALNFRYS